MDGSPAAAPATAKNPEMPGASPFVYDFHLNLPVGLAGSVRGVIPPGLTAFGGILSNNLCSAQTATLAVEEFTPPERTAMMAASPELSALARVQDREDLVAIRRAMEAVEVVSYHWNTTTDTLRWSANAVDVLGCDPAAIASGRGFANLLDPDNITSRFDTIMRGQARDTGNGVSYQIEYLFRPEGKQGGLAVWLEDHGKWFAGPDGRPIEAYGTVRRIDDRHKRDQHLSFIGNCDPLTGMMNRGRMAEALGETITVAAREQSSCAFLIAAINNLPVVNEAYGFEIADEVIVAMGRRLRQVVRTGDAIARYSGSKFGIILNTCSDEDLEVAVERFLSVARDSVIETQKGPVWAMLSVGAINLPQYASDANTAMARAEEALAEALRLPSDGCVIYRPSEKRSTMRALNARCATEIVQCLKADRFKLAYQPIVSATTGKVLMHEALLRMADDQGEMIAAAHLVPVAEKLGLVRLIDRAVVQMTIADLYRYPATSLSINVSGTTATDPRWFNQITDIIAANASVSSRLTVEITETVALSDIATTRRFVETLRNIGCSVAIDDFGAGFTSFRNIRDLPVNILKLDGSFCSDLNQNLENQYFLHALVELAQKCNLKTIAEWVERPEDAEMLRGWGVDFFQGNLFGPASMAPPEKTEEALTFDLVPNSAGAAGLDDGLDEAPEGAVAVAKVNAVPEYHAAPNLPAFNVAHAPEPQRFELQFDAAAVNVAAEDDIIVPEPAAPAARFKPDVSAPAVAAEPAPVAVEETPAPAAIEPPPAPVATAEPEFPAADEELPQLLREALDALDACFRPKAA